MRRWGWIAALGLLLATPAVAQVERLEPSAVTPHLPAEPDGSLRHPASGYHFAAKLGELPVRHKIVYAPDDVAVQYKLGLDPDDAFLDVIVYRATRPTTDEADGMVESIDANWTGRADLADPPPIPTGARDGIARWFTASLDGTPMTTGFVIVERGGWGIVARGSSPQAGGTGARKRLTDAINAIDWTIPERLSWR